MSPTNSCDSTYRFRDIKFDLQKISYGHGVRFSQLHHPLANINIYTFALAFTVSEIYFLFVYVQNIGQDHEVHLSQ